MLVIVTNVICFKYNPNTTVDKAYSVVFYSILHETSHQFLVHKTLR